ncbi:uncharacterized protein LOC132702819 [Cylas formicarius]|uniref:uncharacterized protein LOC132702819 n=1 Tax=Cylas formicarius TaxID=197179 RepID=UPI002958B0F3|nr:uncharacterized protein LOC132702819 [Cylas formicarius]
MMPPDEFYWNGTESESEESLKDYHTLPQSRNQPSYIDPWDLENYAYIREHLDSMELSSNPSLPLSGTSSGDLAEAHSTSFLYVPGNKRIVDVNRTYEAADQGNYADIDELRSERPYYTARKLRYSSFADTEESAYEESMRENSSVFGIYDRAGRFRRVAVPVSVDQTYKTQLDRSISSHEDYDYDPYGSKHDIYSRLDDMSTLPIYDDVRRLRRKKPHNFGLTNYGHLKIDYSSNWNNLNNYIKYKH